MNSVVKMPQFETRAMPENEELRNTYLEEMESLIDKAKMERRSLSVKESRRFDELKSKVGEIDRNYEERDLKSLANNSVITKKGKKAPFSPQEQEEIRSFVNYVRTGESRDLAGANNGAVIPTTIAKQIVDRVFEISALFESATIYNVGENLNLPVYDYSAHVTDFITEFQDVMTTGGTFASISLESQIIGTLNKLGKSLLNRTDLDILPFIINACAKSVVRFLENEIITNANARFASTLPNGVTQTITAETAGAVTPADLVALKNSIPSIMLPDAKWLMHKDTLSYLQSLTDANGNLLFGNNLSEIAGNTLLGYEVMLSDAMPAIGAGARQIYFGNFEEGLAIKLGVQSAEVYKELFAQQYAIGVGHFMEVDVSASHSAQAISVMIGA
jgi:HK97 family phage major capsid protein